MRAPRAASWTELSARERVHVLLDPGSFEEFLPPEDRVTSPHLKVLGSPAAFDDGVAVGRGLVETRCVLVVAQEAAFMGGAVGEVHGAKIVGLLERALDERPDGVLLLLESGGVRLHEANAGLIAVSEIMRAILALRATGVPVIVLDGGRIGVFGGMGIASRLCDAVIMSEEGRLGLSGPEVIETTMGVEEFDASDKALVWRVTGGKHRYLIGDADMLVADSVDAFRAAALSQLRPRAAAGWEEIGREHERLGERLARFGDADDSLEIWRRLGLENPERLPLLEAAEFVAVAQGRRLPS